MAACRGFLARPPHLPGFDFGTGTTVAMVGVSLLLLGLFLESDVLLVVGSSPLLAFGLTEVESVGFEVAFAAEYWLRPSLFCFLTVPFLCELPGASGGAEAGGLGGCDADRFGVPIGLGVSSSGSDSASTVSPIGLGWSSCSSVPSTLLRPALSLRLPAASLRFSSRIRSRSLASLCLKTSVAALRAFLFDFVPVPSSSESASKEPVLSVDGGLGDSDPVRWRLISSLELPKLVSRVVCCPKQMLDSLFAVVASTLSLAYCRSHIANILCLLDNST